MCLPTIVDSFLIFFIALGPRRQPLDWNTRMKIAAGAARGLEYLHNKMNPPVIYRDLKSSNILLGEEYHPKLSDFGLAKVGPTGDDTHVSTRVMGTYGYCAPDYAMTGQLTFKSDIYSFGVLLLEIITGRKAIDFTKSTRDQNLVAWVSSTIFNYKICCLYRLNYILLISFCELQVELSMFVLVLLFASAVVVSAYPSAITLAVSK